MPDDRLTPDQLQSLLETDKAISSPGVISGNVLWTIRHVRAIISHIRAQEAEIATLKAKLGTTSRPCERGIHTEEKA